MKTEYQNIKNKILKYFTEQSHTFDHTERVYYMCLKIAKKEKKVNLKVLKLAALLHDVARAKEAEDPDVCHAEEGAKMAKILLKKENYPEDIINQVCYCIESHRFSKNIDPKTIEALILKEADRLEAIGAICIARVFTSGIIKGRKMHDPNLPESKDPKRNSRTSIDYFKKKSILLKPSVFKTKVAKKVAKARYKFTFDFVKRFEKEWKGEL